MNDGAIQQIGTHGLSGMLMVVGGDALSGTLGEITGDDITDAPRLLRFAVELYIYFP